MTRKGIVGGGDDVHGIVSQLVDLADLGLAELRSTTDPEMLGMVRFFVEKCEHRPAYGGYKPDRLD